MVYAMIVYTKNILQNTNIWSKKKAWAHWSSRDSPTREVYNATGFSLMNRPWNKAGTFELNPTVVKESR